MSHMIKYLLLFLIATIVSCNYNEPNEPNYYSIQDTNIIVVNCENGITVFTEDPTKDEYGNCKYSPYTKFYNQYDWEDGMERVYDAWITLNYEYYIQVIRCDNKLKHKFSVVDYQILDKDLFFKYFNTDKGYGGNKGMIFNN